MTVSVSVVIPTYNRARYVGRAIDSALAQTHRAYEIIVVDDGSSDDTESVLKDRYEERIRYIRQDNAGPSAARNVGIRAAKSEFIAFLDSDDVWLPRKLEVQMPLMAGADVVLSYTNWIDEEEPERDYFGSIGLILESDPVVWDEPIAVLARKQGSGMITPAIVCRKGPLLRVGAFDERMPLMEDARMKFRLSAEGKFAATAEVLVRRGWSRSGEQISKPGWQYFRNCAHIGAEVYLEFYAHAINSSPGVQRQLRGRVAYYLSRQSQCLAIEGNYRLARRKAFESLAFMPTGKAALRAIVGLVVPQAFHIISSDERNNRNQTTNAEVRAELSGCGR